MSNMSEFIISRLVLICAGVIVFMCARRIANLESRLAARWPSKPLTWIANRWGQGHWQAVGVGWILLCATSVLIKFTH